MPSYVHYILQSYFKTTNDTESPIKRNNPSSDDSVRIAIDQSIGPTGGVSIDHRLLFFRLISCFPFVVFRFIGHPPTTKGFPLVLAINDPSAADIPARFSTVDGPNETLSCH